MKEFFGFGGYQRPAEGYFSWQHLLFVTICVTIMAVLAVILGLANRKKTLAQKNKALPPAFMRGVAERKRSRGE